MDGRDNERGNVLDLPPVPAAVELRHLRAFVAVAEELNFSRAAQRLFVTQPALSRQIRTLERLVGCELFLRSTQRVQLTLAGEALLARARPLLADLAEAISATRSVGGELAGRMARLYEPWLAASAGIDDLDAIRAAVEDLHAGYAPPAEVSIRSVTAGGVPGLHLAPAQPEEGAILFLHGAGHIAGSAFGYRHLAGATAVTARTPVVLLDYRLAPEHPYPGSLDDALSAYHWLLGTGVPPGQITVVGDSSGAGLAMSLLLALRQEPAPAPGRAALLCPWVDLTGRLQRPPQDSPVLLRPEMARRFAAAYLAGTPADDPLLDPLRTDLTGLPSLLIHTASGDSVFQEGQMLAEHAKACGVNVTTAVFPVPTHDFHIFWSFLPEAATALDQLGRFVTGTTSPEPQGQ